MTNKGSCHRHGGHEIRERRTKSSLSKRSNKERAREIREENRARGLNC